MSDALPRHIGIIMDGNRRWAKARGLPALKGHEKGQQILREIAKHAFRRGVKYATVFAFSTENWKRAEEEVGYLMLHVRRGLQKYTAEFQEAGVKIIFLGSRDGLDGKVVKAIERAEAKTRGNSAGTLAICFNYGGQQEIADATKKIVAAGLSPAEITPEAITGNLYYPEVPQIDLIIRTSGEQRISNFMLWRAAYSELYFVDKHWPDFTARDLDDALENYAMRNRRFGK